MPLGMSCGAVSFSNQIQTRPASVGQRRRSRKRRRAPGGTGKARRKPKRPRHRTLRQLRLSDAHICCRASRTLTHTSSYIPDGRLSCWHLFSDVLRSIRFVFVPCLSCCFVWSSFVIFAAPCRMYTLPPELIVCCHP